MNAELSTALGGILVALCGVVASVVAVLGTYGSKYVKTLIALKTAQLEAEYTRARNEAATTAVASTEESLRGGATGAAKLEHALGVARTLAPSATASLPDPQLAEVVQAAVGRMRASMPNPALLAPSLAPGSRLSIPVQVIGIESDPPHATIPRPPRMPAESKP
jgi:hypothetical protein